MGNFLKSVLAVGASAIVSFSANADVAALETAVEQSLVVAAMPAEDNGGHSLASRMDWYHVPAISVAVIDGGELVFAKAYGDGATPDTLFQAASLSKPVTAVGVMRLVEQGRLDLDADITRYLTSWALPEGAQTAENPATIRGILSHTAGFTVHGFSGYGPRQAVPGLIDIMNGMPPANSAAIYIDQAPGTGWRYSGGGYVVLQQLIEDVTGEPFDALMQATLLDPAGMRGSSFSAPLLKGMQARQATAHDHAGRERATHTYPEMAPASLWTTPTELSRMLISLMNAYQGEPGILKQESVREMAAQVTDGMGLGFASDGEGDAMRLSHGGSNMGFKALMFAYPARGQGMVLMSGADGGTFLQLEVARALAAHFGWPDMLPKELERLDVSTETLSAYAGRYVDLGSGFDVTVSVEGANLLLQAARGSRYLAFPVADNRFVTRESGSDVVMGVDEGGRASLSLWGMTALKLD